MIATDALLVIAFCLVVVAAIGVRIALSLKDIGSSLDRVAAALEEGGPARGADLHVPAAYAAGQNTAAAAADSGPTETEIAAAIAAASRYSRVSEPRAASPKGSPAIIDDSVVDATAERT